MQIFLKNPFLDKISTSYKQHYKPINTINVINSTNAINSINPTSALYILSLKSKIWQ